MRKEIFTLTEKSLIDKVGENDIIVTQSVSSKAATVLSIKVGKEQNIRFSTTEFRDRTKEVINKVLEMVSDMMKNPPTLGDI